MNSSRILVCSIIVAIFMCLTISVGSSTRHTLSLMGNDTVHKYTVVPNTTMSAVIMPGDVMMVLIPYTPTMESVQLALAFESTHNEVILTIPLIPNNDEYAVALVPIPATLSSGSYTLQTIYQDTQEVFSSYRIHVQVLDREYYKEYIALNPILAKRRSSPASPQVIAEAQELWALTGTVTMDYMYAIDNFMFPLDDYKYVTGMFFDQRVYTYPNGTEINGTNHGGIDIAADTGTLVNVVADGKVVYADERIVTGKSVVIAHFPGVYTMYYHLDSIKVNKGDFVEQGTTIATVGSSGFSTGPHLHWEMRVNNIRVDPLLFLGKLDKVHIIDIQ